MFQYTTQLDPKTTQKLWAFIAADDVRRVKALWRRWWPEHRYRGQGLVSADDIALQYAKERDRRVTRRQLQRGKESYRVRKIRPPLR